MTVGRIAGIPISNRLGAYWSTALYNLGGALFLGICWAVNSFAGDIVLLALVGFAIGPVFRALPHARVLTLAAIAALWVAQRLPLRQHQTWANATHISAAAGTAIWPFVTGAISDAHGIWSMMPTLMALIGLTLLLWALVWPYSKSA